MRHDHQGAFAKKRIDPVGRRLLRLAGRLVCLASNAATATMRSCIAGTQGEATLEQLWTGDLGRALVFFSGTSLGVTAGKTLFLPPNEWTQLHLPYKISMDGGAAVTTALQRRGLVAGLALTRGGQIRVNVWNSTSETICLTPKTVLVRVDARKLWVKYLGQDVRAVAVATTTMEAAADRLMRAITEEFADVGDFSTHPVNARMQRLLEIGRAHV